MFVVPWGCLLWLDRPSMRVLLRQCQSVSSNPSKTMNGKVFNGCISVSLALDLPRLAASSQRKILLGWVFAILG